MIRMKSVNFGTLSKKKIKEIREAYKKSNF